jgi:putative Mn2+ efflux pump MntP|tara:strand:+ start:2173 stop:2367 length:195 start_codon:yes stop_codon:yes gene_type:complete
MLLQKILSRKLIMTLLGVLILVSGIDIPEEVQTWIAGLIMAYVASQGVVDSVEKNKETPSTNEE